MTTNHTPGPWKAVANRSDEDGRKLDRVKAPDGSNVAFIPDHEHSKDEENANATLISAAPIMFSTLKILVSRLSMGEHVSADELANARAAIKIAKVEK